MPKPSVIICTHNPRDDYFRRVLDALEAQTLPKEQWELLVIDNASIKPIAKGWDLSWHPHARHIREDELGLTPARLRGIEESAGELLVFVDDDNVLDPCYLEKALLIRNTFKLLGAFGAGKIKGEFEVTPKTEVVPYLNWLALRDQQTPIWSNLGNLNPSLPLGAGMCVLRSVALAYADALRSDKRRQLLDRRGKALLGGGDWDLALFACKLNLGTGVFPELSMVHLIPARRLEPSYLMSLIEGSSASVLILEGIWNYGTHRKENAVLAVIRHLKRLFSLKGIDREVYQAERRGKKWAHACIAEHS
jgi:glycosyltransferase involved in cell wall biosynthesis